MPSFLALLVWCPARTGRSQGYGVLRCALQVPGGAEAGTLKHVCVGSEWHRFPSAFFLPSSSYRLAFLDFGFEGMLPTEFNTTAVRPRALQ